MGKIIGIDLGTTNSCVAVKVGRDVTVVANKEGSRTTPSIVAFTENGERLVGNLAKRQSVTNPTQTVYAAKRLIGRTYQEKDVQNFKLRFPFELTAGQNEDVRIQIKDKMYSPAEISAMVLIEMKNIAEDNLGEVITEAVITVPAYFNDNQRQATKDAGRIAGINVSRIINEPTAAALAYGYHKGQASEKSSKIAIFDLGGGTFDITLLDIQGDIYEVISTNGNTALGGEDFDNRIIDYLLDLFKKQTGLDLQPDKMALQRLKEAAELCKLELSNTLETQINLPFIGADSKGPKHLEAKMTRSHLESLVEDLIQSTLEPCKTALNDAKLTVDDIEQVILVGGMTRMPRVQEVVREFFKKEPVKDVNPDEVVAIGAAIQGAILSGNDDKVLLLDVLPLSIGVETAGGIATKIIEKNTTIPTVKSKIFSTAEDNQSFVNIHVIQGEREMADDNRTLAKFELTDIPPAPRAVPQIEISFGVDSNGILKVQAKDLGTGKEKSVQIVASSGLTEADIQRMIQEAEAYKKQDLAKKELTSSKIELESLIYTTDRSMKEYGGKLPRDLHARIKEDIELAKKGLDETTVEAVLQIYKKLEESSYKISEILYRVSPTAPTPPK